MSFLSTRAQVPCVLIRFRNFDFKEKAEVDKYYPQFYHKTDKVRFHALPPDAI